ncbi:clan AA aspartic protease [Campylobacter upsaliensis]|nr:clan AA aspartic protease [Campylobacter upsaliensis]
MTPFFKKILPQIFISAILEDKKNTLKICTYRNKKLIKKLEKTFDKSEQLITFIKNYDKKFFPYYIALFLDSEEQGILPSGEQNYDEFGIGKMSIKTLPLANVLLYTATEHIEYFSELCEDCGGLDFLFSPFALLHFCIQKEQKDDKTRLYAFKNSQSLTLMVYKNGEILIGSYKLFEKTLSFQFDGFDSDEILGDDGLSAENTPLEEGEEKKEGEITLDNFNEMLGDKIDALDQEQNDGESIVEKPQEDVEMDDLGKFGADMEICRFIISSIESFYRDSHYGGDFIDELVIFSDEMLLQSTLEFVESEIFLKPQIKLIDTHELMQEVMQKELKYDL